MYINVFILIFFSLKEITIFRTLLFLSYDSLHSNFFLLVFFMYFLLAYIRKIFIFLLLFMKKYIFFIKKYYLSIFFFHKKREKKILFIHTYRKILQYKEKNRLYDFSESFFLCVKKPKKHCIVNRDFFFLRKDFAACKILKELLFFLICYFLLFYLISIYFM